MDGQRNGVDGHGVQLIRFDSEEKTSNKIIANDIFSCLNRIVQNCDYHHEQQSMSTSAILQSQQSRCIIVTRSCSKKLKTSAKKNIPAIRIC